MTMSLVERLRVRGYRLTAQRRVIAEVLEGPNVHFTVDEIHTRASARLPEISRATVYATLAELVELGEVLELSLGGRSKRYDPNVIPAHHHLVCERCGTVHDVMHGVEAPALPDGERHGIDITRTEITYHGRCPACS